MPQATELPCRRHGLDVFAFTSYKRYCMAFYNASRVHSWEWLTRRVGPKAIRTSVHRTIKNAKYRPKDEELDGYAYAFGLKHRATDPDTPEASYFKLLVRYEHTSDAELREYYRGRVVEARFNREIRRPRGWQNRLFAEWYFPVVAEMASYPDFRPDPAWIASRAFPPIKQREAQDAIQLLLELGLFEYDLDGGVQAPREPIIIEIDAHDRPHGPDDAMDQLHGWFAQRAANIARKGLLPRDGRYFKAITLALPDAALPRARKLIDEALRRLLAMQGEVLAESPPDRVHLWVNHFYPLTTSLHGDAPSELEEES